VILLAFEPTVGLPEVQGGRTHGPAKYFLPFTLLLRCFPTVAVDNSIRLKLSR